MGLGARTLHIFYIPKAPRHHHPTENAAHTRTRVRMLFALSRLAVVQPCRATRNDLQRPQQRSNNNTNHLWLHTAPAQDGTGRRVTQQKLHIPPHQHNLVDTWVLDRTFQTLPSPGPIEQIRLHSSNSNPLGRPTVTTRSAIDESVRRTATIRHTPTDLDPGPADPRRPSSKLCSRVVPLSALCLPHGRSRLLSSFSWLLMLNPNRTHGYPARWSFADHQVLVHRRGWIILQRFGTNHPHQP